MYSGEILEGYMNALYDILDNVLTQVEETPEVYKIKEIIREMIAEEE